MAGCVIFATSPDIACVTDPSPPQPNPRSWFVARRVSGWPPLGRSQLSRGGIFGWPDSVAPAPCRFPGVPGGVLVPRRWW